MGGDHGVPRVCGDDPRKDRYDITVELVFPAYAGMIPVTEISSLKDGKCSPRMRG